MYPPNNRLSIQTKGLSVQKSLCTAAAPKAETERALLQAEVVVITTKKYKDDLLKLGLRVKQHEDHIKFLRTQKNIIEDSILDLQVTIGKYHTSTESVTEKEDARSGEGTYEHIKQEKSAAGLICQLKARHETPVSHSPLVKDVLGIVATLGSVDDDNLNWLLAEYVGKKVMLAPVCQTFNEVKAMESYDKEGRFHVICLDNLRPYAGKFVADGPQRRLDLLKPKLPGGEIPCGFVGYAVNMVYIDYQNLSCVTTSGHGLRETLFYYLFSHLQVYRTREEMHKAHPFLDGGAVSLDGGIIRSPGVFYLGDREEAQVKFLRISGKLTLPENYYGIESILKAKKWDQEKLLDDMRQEQSLLDQTKFNFEIKKKEFVRFVAQSSQYAPAQHQQQSPAGRERFTP